MRSSRAYDVVWPPEAADMQGAVAASSPTHMRFAASVIEEVLEKGCCLVQMPGASAAARSAAAQAAAGSTFQYAELSKDVAEVYLGLQQASKVSMLENISFSVLGQRAKLDNPLDVFHTHLDSLGRLLVQASGDYLGCSLATDRFSTMLRRPVDSKGTHVAAAAEAESGDVEKCLDFVQRRKLCIMYAVEGTGGRVTLSVEKGGLRRQTLRANLARGGLLVFRHDLMSYCYENGPGDVVLQAWLMEEKPEYYLKSQGLQETARAILGGPPNPLPISTQLHIVCATTRFPTFGRGGPLLESTIPVFLANADGGVEFPIERFDYMPYYADEADWKNLASQGKARCKHGSLLDTSEWVLFDNDFFGISDWLAKGICPQQRLLLETSFEALSFGGYQTLKSLEGVPLNIAVGNAETDWPAWQGYHEDAELTLQTNHNHLWLHQMRLGHVFGVTGRIEQIDTACSSTLVAANHSYGILMTADDPKKNQSLVCGVQAMFSYWSTIGLSAAGMVGPLGRVMFADKCANGYARGEGTAAILLMASDSVQIYEDRLACMVGCYTNQDGRSASLTAPNGASQQNCVRQSLRTSQLNPDDLNCNECHGTGTALGDPTEVNSIRVIFGRRKNGIPFGVGSAKTNISHLEGVAGGVGMIKSILSLTRSITISNCHLRTLNPHIDMDAFPVYFPTEIFDQMRESFTTGMNSYGFGGTNSRAELWGRTLKGPHKNPRHVEVEQHDYVAVPCSRCSGLMCWTCMVCVPRMEKEGKHRCSTIRDEFASYDYCSDCYRGDYVRAGAIGDASAEGERGLDDSLNSVPYLVGTWSAWTTFEEMVRLPGEDSFAGEVTLGETCAESFRIVLNRDRGKALFPPWSGGQSPTVVGPEADADQRCWRIDGRREGLPKGTTYRVTLNWEGTEKSISWEVSEGRRAPRPPDARFEHSYSIVGSLTGGRPAPMVPTWAADPDQGETWQHRVVLDSNDARGGLEFHIMRDGDPKQTIYPLHHAVDPSNVMGPDAGGAGKYWLVAGEAGEAVQVTLDIAADGAITVRVAAGREWQRTWQTDPKLRGDHYYVAGTWSGWNLQPMETELVSDVERGRVLEVHRYRFTIGRSGREDFKVLANQNWDLALYPMLAGAAPGDTLVCGPDGRGEALQWQIVGFVGQTMEVTLDLNAEDRRWLVSCEPVG